jgi:predicted amidohydrolase YtcJ
VEAVELAASAGLVLDDWQQHVLVSALGERPDALGTWAAFEVGLVVPRQCGKGGVLEARELAGSGVVSPAEALPMLSRDAAWALGYEHQAGSIAVGRPADLAVLRPSGPFSDPLDSILRPDTRVLATLRAGRVLHGQLASG